VLHVRDTGEGISEEAMDHLFEPFYTTKSTGTGLGLSTVYGIVRQHRGGIFVRSRMGKGTKFSVYLPCADAETSLAVEPPKKFKARKNETILLVEDEKNVRELLAEVLSESGFRVLEAEDGLQALKILKKRKRRKIDLLLTDVQMPIIDGLELIDKASALAPTMSILLMSGCVDAEEISRKGLTSCFIPKPFSPILVLERIRETIDCAKKEVD
jgi:CheY-like chemotaxis protein